VVGTKRILEAAGVVPLWNENQRLPQGIWLAGIDDVRTGVPRIHEALAGIPKNVTPLVLSHNPSIFDFTPRREMVLLAGHTHGGQIVPPLLSPKIICRLRLQCRYVAGWYRKGASRLYVSRGIGMTGKPFRYRCPAEIAVFRLLGAEGSASFSERGAEGDRDKGA
jgi:predicted MPP superfamily phosphohydrolase